MEFNLRKDIYYTDEYISLYLNAGEEIFKFEYKEGNKVFMNKAIKRRIIDGNYFDLETAYGYGGYYVNTNDEKFIKKAMNEYKEFCKDNNIVAEFIRFHPFLENIEVIKKFLDFFKKDRIVIFIDLNKEKEYASSLRRNIKKAKKYNLIFQKLDKNQNTKEMFKEMYYKTMSKNNADAFYFFSDEYFVNLFKLKFCHIYAVKFDNKLINMIVVLENEEAGIAYYHLGATEPNYYSINPNAFIFDRLIDYYKAKNFNIFYLGGGNNSDPENPLVKFKKKFSDQFKWFYIGGNIFDKELYNQLKKYKKSEKFLLWRY